MRRARQGKLGKGAWIVFLFVIVFLCLLSVNTVHRPGPNVMQMAQFNALNAATELFMNEFDGYPPSDANDRAGRPYCGAMKLAEALVGQDSLGFHRKSVFRRDGLDAEGTLLYPGRMDDLPIAPREDNLRARTGPFVLAESARVFRLADVYGEGNTGPFPGSTLVLCDTYVKKRPSGRRTGMPILYYRADQSGTTHDLDNPDNLENIYTYKDDEALLLLGVPGMPAKTHPLADPKRFYLNTQSSQIFLKPRPYRADTFILISAGLDGLYGTTDDICNFEWKYRER